MRILVLLLLAISCAHNGPSGSPQEGKKTYSYSDVTGSYQYIREFKNIKQKVISRGQLMSTNSGVKKVLEKSIVVSQLGSIKANKTRIVTMRPQASEFTVWLEGKKYFSRMQINPKSKSMRLTLDSPEAKWQGTSEIPFPRGKYFCFYTQIPECLYHNYLLTRAFDEQKRKIDFYVVWDSFPYVQDQLTNVGKSLFASASLKFDGEIKKTFRYIVEVEGQVIIYLFSRNFDLLKISWIAQGISVVPPGEETDLEVE